MTSPSIPTGVAFGNHVTERGFVAYGGLVVNIVPLDDLWHFDLSRRTQPGEPCPWVLLDETAFDVQGISHSTMIFEAGLLTVGGGIHHNPTNVATSEHQIVYRPGDMQGYILD